MEHIKVTSHFRCSVVHVSNSLSVLSRTSGAPVHSIAVHDNRPDTRMLSNGNVHGCILQLNLELRVLTAW